MEFLIIDKTQPKDCDISDSKYKKSSESLFDDVKPADRLASIDEEDEDAFFECDITDELHKPNKHPLPNHNALNKFNVKKYDTVTSTESLSRWKNLGKVNLTLDSFNEEPFEQQPFQSETTLIGSQAVSQDDFQMGFSTSATSTTPPLPSAIKDDFFNSFKARIAKFLEKPIEKLYGKQTTTQSNSKLVTLNSNVEVKGKSEQNIKKLVKTQQQPKDLHIHVNEQFVPSTPSHPKSSSLLSKISTKLHHLKPFQEVAPKSTPESQPNNKTSKSSDRLTRKSVSAASVGDESAEGNANEVEYLRALKTRKLFESRYTIIKEIGAGGHSTVYLAEKIEDHSVVVCKFIKKSSVWRWYKDPYDGTKIPFEIHVLKKFKKNANLKVIQYHEHYALGSGRFVIVMEYLGEDWCDLYDYVEKFGPVKEKHTRQIFSQVVQTIECMHELGYLHNDVKDENIMINMKTRETKLIDFGSCTPLIPGKKAKLFYGTKKFAAPEALQNEEYVPSCQEVWALGTLLYVLLFKMDPFKTDQDIIETNIAQKIQRLRISGYNSYIPIDITDESVDAMLAMLNKNPSIRIAMKDISKLDFFRI